MLGVSATSRYTEFIMASGMGKGTKNTVLIEKETEL